MNGKTVLITGPNGTLGTEISLGLAKMGARIIMAVIDVNNANILKEKIVEETKNSQILIHYVDLSSQASIREFAAKIISTERQLDVLIHNAGIAYQSQKLATVDGIEMTMAVNYYATFLLTHLLIDLLRQSAPARIVCAASSAHVLSSANLNYNPINSWQMPGYAYYQSKVAVTYFTQELSRRLQGTNVTVTCFCPGLVYGGIHQNLAWYVRCFLKSLRSCCATPAEGAKTAIFLASDSVAEGVSGYNFYKCTIRKLQQRFKDPAKHARLWEKSRELVKLTSDDPVI